MAQRAFMRADVRALPELRQGETKGRAWAFWSVEVLDSDANKVTLTLDVKDAQTLAVDRRYDFEVDTTADGGRIRNRVVTVTPVPAAAAKSA